MVYRIHSMMDTGLNFPQGLSYKDRRLLQFSSENPFDIPSSHHSIRPCLCGFKMVYVSYIGAIPEKYHVRFRPSSEALDCVYSLWYNAPAMLPACSLEAEGLQSLRFQNYE
jgi:hypothetical protein